MTERRVEEILEILVDGRWKQYKSLLYNLSPSTNGEAVEAEPVVFEAPADMKREDLFLFTAAGVPGITQMRRNGNIVRLCHHQSHNSIDVVSMEVEGKLVRYTCALLEEMAQHDNLENYSTNHATKEQVTKVYDAVYGGWNA